MKPYRSLIALCLALFAAVTFPAQAHSVWIEQLPDGRLVLRFGEFAQENETSPGHLDELSGLIAWKHGAEGKPVLLETAKKEDHFLLTGADATNVVQAEIGYEVMTTTNNATRKPYFYARWQPAGAGAGKPATVLDLVPTGKTGEVRVYFRNQPVPDAKLVLLVPGADKEQEVIADKEGFVHFEASKPGVYHLSYGRHREAVSGLAAGQPYDMVSYNAALTWRQ